MSLLVSIKDSLTVKKATFLFTSAHFSPPTKMKSEIVAICLSFALILLDISAIANGNAISISAVSKTNVSFQCNSSFPPPWAKIGPKPGQYKTLMVNGQKHPNLKDSRIVFTRNQNDFKLLIAGVVASDAGNYVCDGDQSVSYLLNVVR